MSDFCPQVNRLLEATGANGIKELSIIIDEKENTISNWNSSERGRIPPKKILPLSQLVNCRAEWLEFGIPPMRQPFVVEKGADYGSSPTPASPYIEKVAQMMADMDEDMQKDICLSVEKEKLLRDLLRQKESDNKAG